MRQHPPTITSPAYSENTKCTSETPFGFLYLISTLFSIFSYLCGLLKTITRFSCADVQHKLGDANVPATEMASDFIQYKFSSDDRDPQNPHMNCSSSSVNATHCDASYLMGLEAFLSVIVIFSELPPRNQLYLL